MNRRTPSAAEREAAQESRPSTASRAAQAAARVAARYANAPSYSELLANEARAAMMAAEAASRAALQAHAAAQSVLDSLEAAAQAESAPEQVRSAAPVDLFDAEGVVDSEPESAASQVEMRPERQMEVRPEQPAFPALEPLRSEASPSAQTPEDQPYTIRWERELPVRQPAPAAARARRAPGLFDSGVEDWREPGSPAAPGEEAGDLEIVEPAQPIFANLIEFPRELVATRKVRPRLAEGPLAAGEPGSQLSIFEVDSGAVSIEPEAAHATQDRSAPAWTGPEWSGIQLDAHPVEELSREAAMEERRAPAIEPAPASRRLLAVVVDVTLIAGAILAAAYMVASKSVELPGLRMIEFGLAVAMLVAGALYQVLFLTLARATPGMWYARIGLCTLEGQVPTRAQRSARLVAMLLSVLPVGVGIAWAIFDDDHLTWHDRLSGTYLRKG